MQRFVTVPVPGWRDVARHQLVPVRSPRWEMLVRTPLVLVPVALVATLCTATPAAAAPSGPANGFLAYEFAGDDQRWPPCMNQGLAADLGYYLAGGGASFSPDGGTIAAVVQNPASATPLTPVDLAEPAAVEVNGTTGACPAPVHLTDVDYGSRLSWSPDGSELAATQGGDVWVLDAATGRRLRNLTPFPGSVQKDPTWDPRGTGIAYTAPDGLRVRATADGPSTLLVAGTASRPDWSPDGKRIAYVDASEHVALVTVATGAVKRTRIAADSVIWSPDGKRLVFGATNDVQRCAVATTAGKVVQVLVDGSPCVALDWQPV